MLIAQDKSVKIDSLLSSIEILEIFTLSFYDFSPKKRWILILTLLIKLDNGKHFLEVANNDLILNHNDNLNINLIVEILKKLTGHTIALKYEKDKTMISG